MTARPFAQIREGEIGRSEHRITADELDAFIALSGDVNPLHVDAAFARRHGFRGRVVHGMLVSAHLSRVLGTVLPGPGAVWLSQDTRFRAPAYVDDVLEIVVRVTHRSDGLRTLVLQTEVRNQRKEILLTGEAKIMMVAPSGQLPWTELVAVVTGGGRGIGAAICEALGAKGARVVVNYRARAQEAEAVAARIKASAGEAIAVQADVSDQAQAQRLASAALEAYGRVDVLVNSATPPIVRKPLLELTWEEVDAYWNVYAQSSFILAQRLVPGMKERGFGRIVHVLTTAMWGTPPAGVAGYIAAKSGAWGLAKGMAVELAPFGITVNAVSPSAVVTEQWDDTSDARLRALARSVPAQRLPSPDEVAAAVTFLAGSDGAYLTGANIPLAGGEVM